MPEKGIKEHEAIGRMIVLEEHKHSKETVENGRMMRKCKDRCLSRIHGAEL